MLCFVHLSGLKDELHIQLFNDWSHLTSFLSPHIPTLFCLFTFFIQPCPKPVRKMLIHLFCLPHFTSADCSGRERSRAQLHVWLSGLKCSTAVQPALQTYLCVFVGVSYEGHQQTETVHSFMSDQWLCKPTCEYLSGSAMKAANRPRLRTTASLTSSSLSSSSICCSIDSTRELSISGWEGKKQSTEVRKQRT